MNGQFRRVITKTYVDKTVRKTYVDAKKRVREKIAQLKTSRVVVEVDGEKQAEVLATSAAKREIKAIVLDRELKKSSGARIYTAGIGPITENDGDGKHVVTMDGERYAKIGKTSASSIQARPGDVLRVEVTELLLDKTSVPTITWFTPMVVDATKEAPHTISEVTSLVRSAEVKQLENLPFGRELPLIKSDSLQYVLGIVLEPNDGKGGSPLDPDAQQDVYSEEDIRKAAWLFLQKYQRLGLMHEREAVKDEMEVVESYIAPTDMRLGDVTIRRGTWLLGARIKCADLWKKVKSGQFAAWSVDGEALRQPLK